ncbi:MAG: 16S rRNA (cytosine(1402)-N(4))-methyltransferase RsmH [bacterium]|nr:16S rRNA (cytosine(1402)-N(4))-methyltransferase RsmH [bacterium]
MHVPVLLKETLSYLNIQPEDIVLDGTIGFGGHSLQIKNQLADNGLLVGLDQDLTAVQHCRSMFDGKNNVFIFHLNYTDFSKALDTIKIKKLSKVILDLGISSYQLDSSQKGFSYSRDETLDMRMNGSKSLTASKILKTYSADELKRIFSDYGEIRNPFKFIDNILVYREKNDFKTTGDLISLIKRSFFFRNRRNLFIKTCAQVFQALRIEVNDELTALKTFLEKIPDYLTPEARVAIISFHSLEDRIVKRYIRENRNISAINKKVIQASQKEISSNTRARSAKMRVFEKVSKSSEVNN